MKAKFLLKSAVAILVMAAAVACNKTGTAVDIAAEVAGSYTGTTSASFQYSPDPYTLRGEGTTMMGMGDEKSEYKATFEGTVGKQAGTADFLITVPAVMGGLTIEFSLAE